MLTKTDYLRYLESPMHLWACKHGWLEDIEPSAFDQHLMAQGLAVQSLAQEFLSAEISRHHPTAELSFEMKIEDGQYFARLDAAVYFPDEDVWDIYEIKSGTSVRKEHLLDAAFQRLVAASRLKVRDTYLLHINKEYQRMGEVTLEDLFVSENVTEQINDLCEELRAGREAAWQVTRSSSPDGIDTCLKPSTCPCPRLCHPNLPDHPIYDLPRIGKKAQILRDAGITAIEDIPDDLGLSEIQARHAAVVKTGKAVIDRSRVKAALDQLVYPLHFLDYETFNPAVPWFDGYSPYQQMVFQYSLHVFDAPGAKQVHYEFLAMDKEEPSYRLAADLLGRIAPSGSVIVWNQSFEAGRNREMASLHPQFNSGLHSINARIFDLMEIFSKGAYVHPDFHGSASIKKVLPVLAPELNYEALEISNGDAAMLAWVEIMTGELDQGTVEDIRQHLLEYCKLDTWAMVRIWQVLREVIQ